MLTSKHFPGRHLFWNETPPPRILPYKYNIFSVSHLCNFIPYLENTKKKNDDFDENIF